MRPWALSTRFHAPVLRRRSLTVLVTMPLSQRKRSSPRTAMRRSQPRSCTAAPEASAAVSALRRVQLKWGQHAAVGGKFMGTLAVRIQAARPARWPEIGCGEVGFRHRRDFPRSGADFRANLRQTAS